MSIVVKWVSWDWDNRQQGKSRGYTPPAGRVYGSRMFEPDVASTIKRGVCLSVCLSLCAVCVSICLCLCVVRLCECQSRSLCESMRVSLYVCAKISFSIFTHAKKGVYQNDLGSVWPFSTHKLWKPINGSNLGHFFTLKLQQKRWK